MGGDDLGDEVEPGRGCDSSTRSSKASERNICAFPSLKNEPKPDLAEERYGMNSSF